MEAGLTAVHHWNFAQKLVFRFFAAYFFIFLFPFPIGYLPFTDSINSWYSNLWDPFVYWAGKNVLHIGYEITVKPNGSGDTTYNYVQLFLMVMLALTAAMVWSVADRKRKSYDLLLYWVMVFIRYYLAFTLMSYGVFKVIKTQFPFPYYHLTETYAESSPMGLLWNFMGYSTAYNMFTGLAEVAGGICILFRKTATFGALVSITVLMNVVALNFCFDVPVKIYSSNLLLMAIFIAIPDMQRLINFFFRNKAVPAVNIQPRFPKRWMKITWLSVKILLVGSVLFNTVSGAWQGYKTYGDTAIKKTPLFGIYTVETFIKNKDTLPPLLTDTVQWKQINIAFADYAIVKTMSDKTIGYGFTVDSVKKTVQFINSREAAENLIFAFSYPDSLHLVLNGTHHNDSVYIVMKRVDEKNSLLLSRGFHWINEVPFNK
jgi:hypothetical protein